jgi:radial spoke head protein 9
MNFSGEHDRILIEASGDSEGSEEDSVVPADDEKLAKKNFTELDRLSYVVRTIEHDCQVVPVGSFRMTPGNELVRNKSFEGLTLGALKDLKNFGHFRKVEQQDKKDLINRGDSLFNAEFLDPLDKDLPKGSWSHFVDASGSLTCLRSLLWPGYVGYHRASSDVYGGVYIGDGIKNSDLPFMLS